MPAFYIDSQSSAKQAIQILQQVFFFDVVKTGKTLNFIAQSAPREVLPIPFDDLAAHQVGQATPEPFELPRPDLEQLPRSVELNFIDLENDYEVGNVQSRSQVEGSQREETFTFPIALNSAQAQQICDALLHRFYLEAIRPSFALLPKYSFLQNADRFSTIIYGETYTFQITGINMGANRLLQLETKLFEPANIENITTEQVISDGGLSVPIASEIITQGNTNLEIMDINLIADSHSDNGLYFSAYGGVNWRECSIYVSNDDSSYYFAGNLTAPGTIGSLAADFAQDDTTLLVSLAAGEFESISAADFAGCINKILVGNEIIQAQNVALEGDNFRLSNLKRGLRGTENFTIHPLGERVILLTGSAAKIIRIDGTAEDIGQIRYFKAPSPGQTLDQAPTTELLIEGNSLRPYAPVNPVATVDAVGNITINWQRRDRHAGNATTYDNLPLSEISEQWEIEVLEGLIVKRVLTSGMSEVSYSVANQQSDFGSPQSSVNVRIFQISATVGRGYPLQVDLAPTLQEAAPEITSFNPVSGGQAATITVLGSGLSGVTEVNINGVAQDNLVVVSDNELSFVVAPGTTSGVITVTSPGGLASSNQAFVFASNTAIPIFNNVVVVDFSRDIQDSDFGALLLVDTNQSDVVLTFDETLLTNPENFGFVVQKDSDLNKVIFADNGSNIVASQDLELIDLYQSKRFYYAGANSWRGL